MADRAAAERACKDPNPIIDGRKANVNLAILGAKPRGNVPAGKLFFFPSFNFFDVTRYLRVLKINFRNLRRRHQRAEICSGSRKDNFKGFKIKIKHSRAAKIGWV